MLNVLLRNFSVTMIVGVAACSFGSTPVGQGSNNSSASKRKDAGADVDGATTTGKRRVSTRTSDVPADEKDLDAGEADSDDAPRDAGDDRKATGGSSGTVTKPANKPTQTPTKPTDAGTPTTTMTTPTTTTTPPAVDAGPAVGDAAVDAGNPIDNLEELAKKSPSQRTSATINKFLTTLSDGDAPASSIVEFLNAINDEVDCKANPFEYECLTACQAVGTTCALCILEDTCRNTMLDICGVSALSGCIPRR